MNPMLTIFLLVSYQASSEARATDVISSVKVVEEITSVTLSKQKVIYIASISVERKIQIYETHFLHCTKELI